MTDHPLTDDLILENFTPEYGGGCYLCGEICLGFNNDDLRAAWDLAVQAVIDFLESDSCSDYPGTLYYPTHGDDESIAEAIHRAMRPQQQEDN